MSFWGNLFNQINPFDHGKTWSNPNPMPQPQPQQAPQQAPQKQAQQQPQMWSLKPQPRVNASLLAQALHLGGDVGVGLMHTASEIAQTPVDLARLGVANLTNNQAAQNQVRGSLGRDMSGGVGSVINAIPKTINTAYFAATDPTQKKLINNTGGLFNVGTYFPNKEAYAKLYGNAQDSQGRLLANQMNYGEIIKKATLNAPQVALEASMIGSGAKAAVNAGAKTTAEAVAKESLLKQIAQQAPVNFALGTTGNAGQQYDQTGKVNVKDALVGGAKMAVGGAVIQGAGNLAGRGIYGIMNSHDAALHDSLSKYNADYQGLQQTHEQLVQKANNLNQNGGSQVAVNQINKAIIDIQNQMMDIRRKAGQVGAVGDNVIKSTSDAPQVGKTPVEPNLNADMFSKENIAKYEAKNKAMGDAQLTPQDKANLPPKEQMALAGAKGTPLAPQEANTQANPFKSDIQPIKQGDYQGAIHQSQYASKPIGTVREAWQHAMEKVNPTERVNFWQAVEHPNSTSHSPEMKNAIDLWRQADNMVHGHSQALGGNTNYLVDHALHPWQLPPEYTNHIISGGSANKFEGLNNLSRKYRTINDAPSFMQLGTDPIGEGSRYLQANAEILRRESLKQGLAQADSGATSQFSTRDLGGGHSVKLSKEGMNATKGVAFYRPTDNPVIKGVRSAQQGLKSTILSLGQFHSINIGALRAAPSLVMEGHPIAAAKGLYGVFRGAFGTEYADHVIGKAIMDGTVEKAAQIGMPYGAKGYTTEGTFLKGGIGHETVFGKQMPMMHDQVARSIISDLEKKGIDLHSKEAQLAGKAGNNMMGFVNKEVQNIPPAVSQGMSDVLLAKQFTHSKFSQVGTALTKGGVGGSYARANVLANVAATSAIIIGTGYALKQTNDNVKDSLLRAIFDPAIATPAKDSKGNDIRIRMPGTDTADLAKLAGIKLVRNPDGHLGVSWDIHNAPGAIADFARSRLSPFLSAGVKVRTNTTYAGKPLYDPSASIGTKVQQAGVSLGVGSLPIGLQGVPYTDAVKSHLPQGMQDVLNAQQPGNNPLLKSIGSSFGFTPSTDSTSGKALDTSRYYGALKDAGGGLNNQEKAALTLYTGSKKNPVTGAYDVQPNVNDNRAKASTLLQNPKVIDNLITMNQTLANQGQSVDPLWQQSKDNITKYLQYQAMPPGGADRTKWINDNKSWYTQVADGRANFFGSLPPGDPNKPSAPIEFPKATPATESAQKTFFTITDPVARANFLQANPDVQKQLDAQVEYNNNMRSAQGYSQLDTFPKATPEVQKIIDTYNNIPKGGGKQGGNLYRSQWIQSHPKEYNAMTQYFTQSSLYNLEKDAGQAQFKDTGFSQAGLKAISNLGQYDIGKTTDANGNTLYALNGQGSSSSGSGGFAFKKKPSVYTPKAPSMTKVSLGKPSSVKSGKAKITKFAPVTYKKPKRIKIGTA